MMLSMQTRYVGLQDNSKIPDTKTFPHGHLDAVAWVDIFGEYKNYGIVLDGMYIVVDFDADHPERVNLEGRLPPTWQQKTPKGIHYLYTIPPTWSGKNKKLKASDGTFLGDLKSKGYIVGPGSEVNGRPYELLNEFPPVLAPQWLLNLAVDDSRAQSGHSGPEFDVLPDGSRDDALYRIGSLARKIGFSEVGIRTVLDGIVSSGAIEQPEGREIEDRDIERLARSASRHDSEYNDLQVLSPELVTVNLLNLIRPVTEWLLYGFIPLGELVTMYGRGGIGKSTFASWLTAELTKNKKNVLVEGVEESIERFGLRAVLGGAESSRIYSTRSGSSWQFPRDIDALAKIVVENDIKLVFFDSIYTHFGPADGLNSAERTRQALSPLAEMSQKHNVTVLCNFHENKAGVYLGSVEMANVARVMLQFTRRKGGSLLCRVDKTNRKPPGYYLKFAGNEVVAKDPVTGEVQMEKDRFGVIRPETIIIAANPEEIKEVDEEEESQTVPDFVNLANLAEI